MDDEKKMTFVKASDHLLNCRFRAWTSKQSSLNIKNRK
jgi:hypothetical protein